MHVTRLIYAISLILLVMTSYRSWRVKSALHNTTLFQAWLWAIIAQVCGAVACFASATGLTAPIADQLWYFTAILTLCPFISVLGARSPTHRVWNWFIIIPLIAVLGWPALTLWFGWPDLPRLGIQLPVLIGFGLVSVMGLGNYLGTRYGSAVLCVAFALICILHTFSISPATFERRIEFSRALGVLFIVIGILRAFQQSLRPTVQEAPFDRLWFDFQDTFGIVWAIRIQERVNQTAESEQWHSRLGPQGFYWQNLPEDDLTKAQELRTASEVKMEKSLRWLLRRFVEPGWIDERLQS